MERHVAEAGRADVEATMAPDTAARVAHVRSELKRLKDPNCKRRVREYRQEQLMRFCDARVRRPQRLTTLTLVEERGRWQPTLQQYDRLWRESHDDLAIGGQTGEA